MSAKKPGKPSMTRGSKLTVEKETLRDLPASGRAARAIKGGWIRPPISWSCPQPGFGR